jgi:dTDP-4-dehydrorhamnose reductase
VTRRVLITGAGGILGTELQESSPADVELIPRTRAQLDITDRFAVRACVKEARADVVIHAAAQTNVDGCEAEIDQAFKVNWIGSGFVAAACEEVGARLVYLSTDYVFDGRGQRPYLEHDPVAPLSAYGRSKWFGEQAVRECCRRAYIIRTQWIYGAAGRNFVDTMLSLGAKGDPLRVVNDQRGCPTYARDLAQGIFAVLQAEPGFGTYHLSSRGDATWFEFAREVFQLACLTVDLSPCETSEYPRPAPRPAYGVLRNYHCELTMGDPMPAWQDGLSRYLKSQGSLAAKGGEVVQP